MSRFELQVSLIEGLPSTLNSFMGKADPWEAFPKSSQAFARQPLKPCRFLPHFFLYKLLIIGG